MIARFAIACALIAATSSVDAGWHHHRRYVGYPTARIDYAPYSIVSGYSVHGPALYSAGYRGTGYGTTIAQRSYYNPINYGYARGYGAGLYSPYRGIYRSRYSRVLPGYAYGYGLRYPYGGLHFTRYGIYGGSFYTPLTVGYPYATGYLSAVRPVQPYLHAYSVGVATPFVTAYTPSIYGAYGYGCF